MKSVKPHQEEEEEEDEEIVPKREGLSSNNKDGKNNDKANLTRSKHSVTEQRRRCKINERYQILRDLIPNSEQKRDTASFLLEVIEYVQYLQEKVQKYEGSHHGWSMEPTKLMPWRNSHWRAQSLVGPTQAVENDSGPVSAFPGRFDENDISSSLTIHQNSQNLIEIDPSRGPSGKIVDQQPESLHKATALPIPLHASVSSSGQCDGVVPYPMQRPISDAQSTGCQTTGAVTQEEDLAVEGGRISLTSVYSQGLLNNLTQALECAGIDLSRATISVQVDIGKRANRKLTSGVSSTKDPESTSPSNQPIGNFRDAKELDQTQKRLKI